MSDNSNELRRLQDRLAEAGRREGEFRLKSAADFLALEARLDAQARALGERDARIHELHLARAERDRYVHQLHLERIELRQASDRLHADLEAFTWMLEAADAGRAGAPASPDLPAARFLYHLQTSPFRIYRESGFTFRGWAVPEDGRAVSAIRARVDEKEFPGRHGLPGPESGPAPHPKNPQPGFEVAVEIPPGRHRLRFEVRLEDGGWISFLNLPIWRA